MNIAIAVTLLFFLMSLAGRKREKAGDRKHGESPDSEIDDASWIEELEILDILDEDQF